jgi:type IV secretory pathway VirJ component
MTNRWISCVELVASIAAALLCPPVSAQEPLHHLPVHRYAPAGTPVGGVIFFSGDGGWRGFDRADADSLSAMGYWVLGVDDFKLFIQEVPADSLTSVTQKMLAYARTQIPAGAPIYLAGYSFGANIVADAAGSRVPVDGVIMLGPSRRGIRKITLDGYLFREPTGPTSYDVADRLNARGCIAVAFVIGDRDKSGKGAEVFPLVQPPVDRFVVPGAGHHYDGGDSRYTTALREALSWLETARAGCPGQQHR